MVSSSASGQLDADLRSRLNEGVWDEYIDTAGSQKIREANAELLEKYRANEFGKVIM